MYNHYSIAGASIAAPTTASFLPLDFPLGPSTEPFWLVLGGFAIFAALSAAKRIAPTWTQLVGADGSAPAEAVGGETRAPGRHRAPERTRGLVGA